MRHKVLRVGLRLIGPVLLIVVILRMKDMGAILRTFREADPAPFIAAILLNFLNLQMKISRWRVLLNTQGVSYPMKRAWAAYMGSSYIGLLTPGRVGDVLRAQYLRFDKGLHYADGLASVVMDRLCDLYVLAIFSAIGIIRFSSVIVGQLAYSAWATVALIILGPLVLLIPGLAEGLMLRAYTKLSKAADPTGFSRFLAALRLHVGRLLTVTTLLTVFAFLINYAQAWLLARALRFDLSFFDAMCLTAIVSLLGLLPISVSGIGVRELFFSLAFPVLGFGPELGVSFGLLFFAVIYVVLIGVGFVAFQLAPPPVGPLEDTAAPGQAPAPAVEASSDA